MMGPMTVNYSEQIGRRRSVSLVGGATHFLAKSHRKLPASDMAQTWLTGVNSQSNLAWEFLLKYTLVFR